MPALRPQLQGKAYVSPAQSTRPAPRLLCSASTVPTLLIVRTVLYKVLPHVLVLTYSYINTLQQLRLFNDLDKQRTRVREMEAIRFDS